MKKAPPKVMMIAGEYNLTSATIIIDLPTEDYSASLIDEKKLISLVQRHLDTIMSEGSVTVFTNFGSEKYAVLCNTMSNRNSIYISLINMHHLISLYSEEEHSGGSDSIHPGIIGRSAAMKRIMETVKKIAKVEANVLLTGESGVGKTLIASVIHSESLRKSGPFITINCGAIPETLLESELFGYEKGAFTGANQYGKAGLIELAHEGVLFLDEIGDLPMNLQVKLLKVIQDKKLLRVGGVTENPVNFRLIAATNKDILTLVREKKFREDLYYRLNVLSLYIPPLRERREDIPQLISHFADEFCRKYKVTSSFPDEVIDRLISYSWPGNTRELENAIERMVILSDGSIVTWEMFPELCAFIERDAMIIDEDLTLKEILEKAERAAILDCYSEYKTTVKVAEILGISQPSASIKLKRYLEKDRTIG